MSKKFQSTPPARGATVVVRLGSLSFRISIHAPREGGDSAGWTAAARRKNFNPRPPRGGRHAGYFLDRWKLVFQSTPPARGATLQDARDRAKTEEFQSTPPARGATAKMHSFTCGSLTNK